MNNGAHVGSSVVIKGELSAKEDIRIAGRVEGRVDVEGFTVILEEGGELHADVSATGHHRRRDRERFARRRAAHRAEKHRIDSRGPERPDDPRRRRCAGDREDGYRGIAEGDARTSVLIAEATRRQKKSPLLIRAAGSSPYAEADDRDPSGDSTSVNRRVIQG